MSENHIIAVLSPSFAKSETLLGELRSLGATVVVNQTKEELGGEALVKFLQDAKATIAVIGKEYVTQAVLSKLPKLKAIAKYGVGTDSIDFDALSELNIQFGYTAGVNRDEVAEQVLGFSIGHFRRLFVATNEMRSGTWNKNGGRDLASLTVGIIGFGHVGTKVAELFKPFGASIKITDILDKTAEARKYGANLTTLDDLIKTSDLISLHVPLTTKTVNMFTQTQFERMKKDALLINTARGEVVDFEAAVKAVTNRTIGGYAADVFTEEPVDLSVYGRHENLYFTPHIAANSTNAVLKMGRSAISWVKTFISSIQA
jgi:phosphoglycerate dehydrogenase-like enzyme